MKRFKFSALLSLLLLSALACNWPVSVASAPPTSLASVQTQAALDLAATLTAALPTPLASPDATATALSAAATVQAESGATQAAAANATAMSATAVAQAATANALSATLTAQAFPPPPPPPPPIPAYRISFAPGATSASVEGAIPAAQPLDYVVAAQAGQTLLASVSSPNNNVYLGVAGVSSGVPLQRTAAGQAQFTGPLPATQDYRLTLVSPFQPSNYSLLVIIPARIQFQPGAFSASLAGQLPAAGVNYYLAAARAGQTMTVQVTSPNNDLFLTIYGMTDGSPLVRSAMEQVSWTGVLPLTQDYMIEVVATAGPSGYTLQVFIQ